MYVYCMEGSNKSFWFHRFPYISPKSKARPRFFVQGPLRSVGNQISVLLNAPLDKNLGQLQHGNCISSGHENSNRVILN